MTSAAWPSLVPPLVTIALAIWTKRIIPSHLAGLLLGGYLLGPSLFGGFEVAVDHVVATLTDKDTGARRTLGRGLADQREACHDMGFARTQGSMFRRMWE